MTHFWEHPSVPISIFGFTGCSKFFVDLNNKVEKHLREDEPLVLKMHPLRAETQELQNKNYNTWELKHPVAMGAFQ